MATIIAMPLPSALVSTGPCSTAQSQWSTLDSSTYASQDPQNPLTRARPRLALNTSCQRTLPGRGASALRLDTLSAISPTVSNTYKNTFEICATPTLPFNTQRSVKSKPSLKLALFVTPPPSTLPTQDIPSSPISTSSSIANSPSLVPYNMPLHLRSILSNSPFTHPLNNRVTTSSATGSKQFFPPTKRVTFRAQLAEEIRTTKYTLRHSDLPSRDTSPAPEDEVKPASKREASSTPTDDVENAEEHEKSGTPVIGRRKKIRDWTWTLGSVTSVSIIEQDKIPTVVSEEVPDTEEA